MSYIGKYFFGQKSFFLTIGYVKTKCQSKSFSLSRLMHGEYQTMQQIREKLQKILETDVHYTTEPKSKSHLLKYLPKSQDEIPIRKMKDSFDIAIVPLSTNLELRDKYTTFSGQVRLGRLMEDMDLFAGFIAYKHIKIPKIPSNIGSPVAVVTVSVSQIDFSAQSKADADIRLSGHVCWVGKTSLEIIVWLHQRVNESWEQITKALILMAARNPMNNGPGIVNRIEAETPEEKELMAGGEERKKKRRKKEEESVLKTAPTEEELHVIHNLFMETIDSKDFFKDKKILPPNSKWMQDATLSNLVFCHPEHRNLHNKIFGGFLIRQALELSWTIGFLHGFRTPKLIHISDITFYSPVDVGSLLKLYGSVTYTDEEHIQVFIYAEAYSTFNPHGKSTNSFNFTFRLGKPLDQVYPSTYMEAMKYIDGRRRFNEIMTFSKERTK